MHIIFLSVTFEKHHLPITDPCKEGLSSNRTTAKQILANRSIVAYSDFDLSSSTLLASLFSSCFSDLSVSLISMISIRP